MLRRRIGIRESDTGAGVDPHRSSLPRCVDSHELAIAGHRVRPIGRPMSFSSLASRRYSFSSSARCFLRGTRGADTSKEINVPGESNRGAPPDLANDQAILTFRPRRNIRHVSTLSLALIHAECGKFGAPPRPRIVIDDITHGAVVVGRPPVTRYTRSHCLGATGSGGGASSLPSSTPPRPPPPPPSSSPPPLHGIATQVRLERTCPSYNSKRSYALRLEILLMLFYSPNNYFRFLTLFLIICNKYILTSLIKFYLLTFLAVESIHRSVHGTKIIT